MSLSLIDLGVSTANLADACDRLHISPQYARLTPISPGMRMIEI